MNINNYFYTLPKELIAQKPFKERDKCKLLMLKKDSGRITHGIFSDVIDVINKNDTLVINNTRVFPAKLMGFKEKTKGRLEILLVNKEENSNKWNTLINRSKGIVSGAKILFDNTGLEATVKEKKGNEFVLEFSSGKEGSVETEIRKIGLAPLPPYIKRLDFSRTIADQDLNEYQTVYSKYEGSIAAPTAGMHFTDELLAKIRHKGANIAEITMHVGKGTFMPVKSATVEGHVMEKESYQIDENTADLISKTKKAGGRIIAVGTTVARTLETVANKYGIIKEDSGSTDLYITEGFDFKVIDGLISNFHLPASTNVILVASFAGREMVLNAYNEAVRENYRFYSYGDAMLII